MSSDNYDAASSLLAYYPSRTTDRRARHWAREVTLHNWADFGAVEFFEGGGSNPTVLSGYATDKFWLHVEPGITDEPGVVRYYAGGDAALLASWPILNRDGYSAHIRATSGGALDFVWSTETSGDPGTGKVLGNNATIASITALHISKTGRQGQSYASRIAVWNNGSQVRIHTLNGDSFVDVRLTGAPSDQSFYYVLPCVVLASNTLGNDALIGVVEFPTDASASANNAATAAASQVAAAASEAAAAASEATAAANAAAIAALIGAAIYATYSAANAAVGGLTDGDWVVVVTDEEQGGQISIYEVVAGALAYRRALADVSLDALAERDGFAPRARRLQNAISALDMEAYGPDGGDNALLYPKTITASQTGATVTASASIFTRQDLYRLIVWDSGEEALIVGTNAITSNTVTVDRSQSVSSGTARLIARPIVEASHGDSIAYNPVWIRALYRAFGFGGYVMSPGGTDNTILTIATATVSGGASSQVTADNYENFPWSSWWRIPTDGTLDFKMNLPVNPFFPGDTPPTRLLGMAPHHLVHDTAVIVWKRGAGSIKVQRRKINDLVWADVETIADTSVGSRFYNFARYKHALANDWEYRVLGLSGTVDVAQVAFFNRTTPGFVHWWCARGGRLISEFNALDSDALRELCEINIPTHVAITSTDGVPGETAPEFYDAIRQANRDLWAGASNGCDFIHIGHWQATAASSAPQAAEIQAIRRVALRNDDSYVSFESFVGRYLDSGGELGLVHRDNIHTHRGGDATMLALVDRVVGAVNNPNAYESRKVRSPLGDFERLRIRGDDVARQIESIRNRDTPPLGRGMAWHNRRLVGSIGAAIGASDWTYLIEMDWIAPGSIWNMLRVNADAFNVISASQLEINALATQIRVNFRDADGNFVEYRQSGWSGIVPAKRRCVFVARSDRAANRIDFFLNGKRVLVGAETRVVTGTEFALADWEGVGTVMSISQDNLLAERTNVYSAMFWRERLADDEIARLAEAAVPQETAPDFWWAFAENAGRVVSDRTGNGRHALIEQTHPVAYDVSPADFAWKYPRREGYAPAFVANRDGQSNSKLLPFEDVIISHTTADDWTLPATPQVGDMIRVTRTGNSGIDILCPANTTIQGAGGTGTTKLAFNNAHDTVELRCTTSDAATPAYVWTLVSASGAVTIT